MYKEVKYFAERPNSDTTQKTFLPTDYRLWGAEPSFCSLFILPLEKEHSGIWWGHLDTKVTQNHNSSDPKMKHVVYPQNAVRSQQRTKNLAYSESELQEWGWWIHRFARVFEQNVLENVHASLLVKLCLNKNDHTFHEKEF